MRLSIKTFNVFLSLECSFIFSARVNTTGKQRGSEIWRKMYLYYMQKREEFLMHYHKRSNVESTFNMLKRKFGDHLRSKNETSQNNEILTKCLAHNLCVLIQESFELGIEIDFKECGKIPIYND